MSHPASIKLKTRKTEDANGSQHSSYILQVLVTSSKKRQVATIDVIELQEIGAADSVDGEGRSDSKSTG